MNSSKKFSKASRIQATEEPRDSNSQKGTKFSHKSIQSLCLQDRLGRKTSQGLYTPARYGLYLLTKLEKENIREIKSNMKLFHLYYNYIQLISISNKHPLTLQYPKQYVLSCGGASRVNNTRFLPSRNS